MIKAYLCLGSNLGDRGWYLQEALRLLLERAGSVTGLSRVYESEGWGTHSVKHYLNQVVELQTALNPFDLLRATGDIEQALGRRRNGSRNEDRVIDIDLLFYGNYLVQEPHLQVPHPRLHLRRFVLVPLNELAPGLIHPVLKRPVNALLRECPDNLFVTRFGQES